LKQVFKRLSIRQKQMAILMATSTVALLMAGFGFVVYEVIAFRNAMAINLSSLASIVGENSTAALAYNGRSDATNNLNTLSNERNIVAAGLYDKRGQLFASFPQKKGSNFVFPGQPPGVDRHFFADERLHMFRRIYQKGELEGTLYLCADATELSIRLRQYVVIVAVVLCASIVVALMLSLRLQRFVSEPILQLAAMARVVSHEKNYGLRAPGHGSDEIGVLMNGFNEMLEQIQARDAALEAAREHLEMRVQERTAELETEVAERRRAEEQLTQQLMRINLLNSITRAVIDRQDLESIVLVVVRQLQDHLSIALGRLFLYDAATRRLIAVARPSTGSNPDPMDLFFSSQEMDTTGLELCREGKVLNIGDSASCTLPVGVPLRAGGLGCALFIPLLVENGFFGILIAGRKETESFSAEESEFLRIVGEQVGLAAHQARLHSQLQHAYDELRQTQVAVMQQERLRALGQMASGIAHDINNALCPIVVYTDLLLQAPAEFTDATLRNLRNIKTAGEDIAHIVSRMREFYRRRDTLDALASVDLNQAVQQVIDLTRPRWRDIPQAHGIMIDMKTDLDSTLPKLSGIEAELREAMTNLILNAIDAMPEGGQLLIRTRSATWDKAGVLASGSTHAIIEVCDSGIGMNEETRRRCLEPFFSTKGKRGTGLGLAMVYGVVERHEGKIEIDSAVGRGTTMRIIFPIRVPKVEEGSGNDAVQAPARLPALRLLCIDDEPLLREMLKQILENGGHTVEVADGGNAGIEVFRSARQRGTPFDVVITDLGMPYLDGRQLAQMIKSESAQTPIIMLTGWGAMMKEDGDLPAQVDGVLSKPPKIAELYDMLRAITGRGKKRKTSHARN